MYHVERTADAAGLWSEPESWDRLSAGVPLREAAWISNWWKVYGEGREAYVVTVRDAQGTLRGALPLYRLETGREERTLCAMGDGNTCTDHVSVLARPDEAAAVCAAIGRWLARVSRDRRDGWDLIDLEGVVGGDAAIAGLVETLRSEGAVSHARSRMNTWIKDTTDGWESHLARLSKTHRRKSRKQRKTLEAAEDLRYRVSGSKDEVRRDLDALIEMHQRRWTAVGEAGSFAEPRSREFLHAAAQDFFDRGQLQLVSLDYGERTIGSELRVIGGNRVMYCYSTGMDMEYGRFEPGRLINIQGLLYAYEHGLREIDCMRGDEPYKKRLLAKPRPLIRLRIAAPSLLPRLRHAAWLTHFEVEQFIRRRAGRSPVRTLSLG